MTASMFDLSTAGKSRSRLGKFKDKVRGKKKESEPPVVPSLTQVLTDSEEEEEAANGDAEGKGKDKKSKKLKMKSLFAPKSNLQRNMSQSMSVLPAKNSPLSGSQPSGLNVEASEGKKKFKFSMHKRSGSSSNKNVLSGSQKQTPAEQSNLCINGSHVYCEEPLPRTKAEREAEEELRREEEERIKKEQIKRDEEKRREEEEERARKEKEENERAEEMRRKEEEKRRKEEEERIKKEQIKRDEEKRREEEEERARKEKEENERAEEMRPRKLEKEIKIDQEQRAAEKTSQKPKPAEIASNQFEDFSPPEPHGLTDKDETVLRCQPEVSSARSGAVSADETDLIKTQWEKRLAPQPPGRNPSETQRQNEDDTRHLSGVNKQSKEKDIKTVSVPPQRSMQMITLLNRSPEDVENVPSEPQNNHAKATKHGKRPAPFRPPPGGDEPPSKPRRDVSQTKRVGTPQSLNPFEDDELTDDAMTHGPPAGSQTANKDDASQAKIKSSKVARAPAPPALSEARYDKGDAQPRVKGHVQAQESSYKETEQNEMVAGVKEEGPPVKSRRRLTVKPLNPLEQQQPTSLVQEENCRSTGSVHTGDQCNSKVEAVITGPYSQLTQEELISMVLKQEKQLSEREKKISELERYIDNLLVRVIEEQPSILMSLSALK
uniref:RAB11 family interacting protein 1 (Class I) b n=1 Tax=Nothobranchius kadleci TaxID=1051664 RepID=A0A1A8C5C7_NOTKA